MSLYYVINIIENWTIDSFQNEIDAVADAVGRTTDDIDTLYGIENDEGETVKLVWRGMVWIPQD